MAKKRKAVSTFRKMSFITTVSDLRSFLFMQKHLWSNRDKDEPTNEDVLVIYRDDDNIRIRRIFYNIEIDYYLPTFKIVGDMAIAISAPSLLFCLKKLPEDERIEFVSTGVSKRKISWTLLSDHIDIRGYGREFRPKLKLNKPDDSWHAIDDWAKFQSQLSLALPFVSKDELRMSLQGVFLEKNWLNATDGHRLARIKTEIPFPEIFIPDDFALSLSQQPAESAVWRIYMKNEVKVAEFWLDNHWFKMELWKENFPDITGILSTEYSLTIEFNRNEMLSMVEMLLPMVDPYKNSIQWHITDILTIKLYNQELNISAKTTFPCFIKGKGMVIGFNPDYIIQILKSFTSERVFVKLSSPISPSEWSEGKDDRENIRVLMPVKIS